ncbi:cobalt-precorrin-6A reductase [Halocynthiibacter namhaensis]|uniref:cobalt-precorrin-6A reductase n=1 Tax=Halocynthiibacter namhaensis TaxID=1290553 RepID=UPI0005798443|nr:cobalt-precorrin-6A reductase [Halocynthiibacter namhaensis]
MTRILLLGGTTEATRLAHHLANTDYDVLFSYAGRTANPVAQPLPTRVGGFGGVDGLSDFLRTENITHVIDATHPFAAQMSTNAVSACATTQVNLAGFERAPWQAGAGDNWQSVADIQAACDALPSDPTQVFLAIGKQHIDVFATRPEHRYLLRLVDKPTHPLPMLNAHAVIARGPFDLAGDLTLLKDHDIKIIISKNAGGIGAQAKLEAARTLGLKVIMIDRPFIPARQVFSNVDDVMTWLDHSANRGV